MSGQLLIELFPNITASSGRPSQPTTLHNVSFVDTDADEYAANDTRSNRISTSVNLADSADANLDTVHHSLLFSIFIVLLCVLWASPLFQYNRFRRDTDIEMQRKARTMRWPQGCLLVVCIASCCLEALQLAAYAWRHQPRSAIQDFFMLFIADVHSFHPVFWTLCTMVWLCPITLCCIMKWQRVEPRNVCILVELFETFSILIQSTVIRMVNVCAFQNWHFPPKNMDWTTRDVEQTPACRSTSYAGHLAASWLCIAVYWTVITEVRARYHLKQSEFTIDFRFIVAQSQMKFLVALASQSPADVLIPSFFCLNLGLMITVAVIEPFNYHQLNFVRTTSLLAAQVLIAASAINFYFKPTGEWLAALMISCSLVTVLVGILWHRRQLGSGELLMERELKDILRRQAGSEDLLAAAAEGELSLLTIDPTYHAVRAVCTLIFDFKRTKNAFVVFTARESEQIVSAVTALKVDSDGARGMRMDKTTAAMLFRSIEHSNSTSLTDLSLAGHGFDALAIRQLSIALCGNSNVPLRTLDLRLNGIDARGLAELSEYMHNNKTLRTLVLAGNSITQMVESHRPQQGFQPEILADDGLLTFKELTDFIQVIRSTEVSTLDLGDNFLTLSGGVAWQAAFEPTCSWNSLHTLNLEWNQLGSVGAEALASTFISMPNLQTINLRGNRINDAGIAALGVELGSLCDLRTLQLEGNNIGALGIAAIASQGLPRCQQLEVLNLRRNDLQAGGLRILAECLPTCTSLHTLNLSSNALCGIDDLGGRYGAHGHSFVQEHVYDVSGFVALAAYLRQPSCTCQILDLSSNHIGSYAVPVIDDKLCSHRFHSSTDRNDMRKPAPRSSDNFLAATPSLSSDGPGTSGSSAAAVLAPAMEANVSLTKLLLQYNKLQISCIATLTQAFSRSVSLQTVDLRGSACTVEGEENAMWTRQSHSAEGFRHTASDLKPSDFVVVSSEQLLKPNASTRAP